MKLKIMGFNDIEISENEVTLLVIQNHHLFAKVIMLFSLYGNKEFNDSELILVDHDILIKNKDFELITDIIHLSLNDKKMLSLIYQNIQDNLMIDHDLYDEYTQLIMAINRIVLNELNNYNITFQYDSEVSINSYLKNLNIKIEDKPNELLFTRILDYIELYSELYPQNLLVFVGIKAYLENKEIDELYKYIMYKKLKCLFIENSNFDAMNCKKYIIYNDFSEDIL